MYFYVNLEKGLKLYL